MPYFLAHSADLSAAELAVMKRAFEAALDAIGGARSAAIEREAACAIIGAAQCGCFDHDKLVAIGAAAGHAVEASRNSASATSRNEPSAAS
jgi:hypothetical protein